MREQCVAGLVHRPGEGAREGWLVHDGARILDAGEGAPPGEPLARGLVLPALVDAHTHVADRVARGVDISGLTLAQAVAPPDGVKHRLLRETPRDALVVGMRRALDEAAANGQRALLDFREQGPDGVEMLRQAAHGHRVRALALGRCVDAWDDDAIDDTLSVAEGIGLPGLDDVPPGAPERAAERCRRARRMFALHYSEARRDDAARVVALAPDFVVHGVHATAADARALADAAIPLVLCPRSNARFGPLPDVPALLDAGVTLALGSDNAMLQTLDVLAEARALAAAFPDVPHDAWLDAATAGGTRAMGEGEGAPRLEKGAPARLVVLDAPDARTALRGPPPRLLHATWTNA